MICAIMQPTFLPWAGYFNLMSQVDDFVFLDDVQLEKQSWQTRNRLLMNGCAQWVSLPLRHSKLSKSIKETEVLDIGRWGEKLAKGFKQNYGKHPHYAAARDIIDLLMLEPEAKLATLNETVIRFVAEKLEITTRLHRAGELGVKGARSTRLISLCEHFKAKEYLSPAGAADYLSEDGFTLKTTTTLRFQEYHPQAYLQKGSQEFFSHLSIVDVIANLGWDGTRKYIIKGVVDEL
jgi:hypothetical protein|tara:strand:+ start:1309 stop:2013 length:705 start_codon:yes stop_codon:yes gene_type:complete